MAALQCLSIRMRGAPLRSHCACCVGRRSGVIDSPDTGQTFSGFVVAGMRRGP
jgi:hypothetical protein